MNTHFFKGDLGDVYDVGAISLVAWVVFIPEDEGDVCGAAAGRLVSLPGEGDPGSCFPALLHHHVQHLLFGPQAAAVGVEATTGDLHLLRAALHHVVQGHGQVVHHGVSLQPLLAFPHAGLVAGEPAQVAEGELPEGVEQVVFVVAVASEDVKVVRVVEEGGKCGVGVVVAEQVALAC